MIPSQKQRSWLSRFVGFAGMFAVTALVTLWPARAQTLASYTKIASVTTTTYADTAVKAGDVWQYVVTAFNAAGESSPSNAVDATTPNTTATHSNTLSWSPASTGGVPSGYNVYRMQVTVPNPPASLAVTSQ